MVLLKLQVPALPAAHSYGSQQDSLSDPEFGLRRASQVLRTLRRRHSRVGRDVRRVPASASAAASGTLATAAAVAVARSP